MTSVSRARVFQSTIFPHLASGRIGESTLLRGQTAINSSVKKRLFTLQSSQSSSLKLIRYGIAGGALVGIAGAYSYVHNELGGPEGIYRSLSFYSAAIPRYLEYRLLQIRKAGDDDWDELHERASSQGLDKINELRGRLEYT